MRLKGCEKQKGIDASSLAVNSLLFYLANSHSMRCDYYDLAMNESFDLGLSHTSWQLTRAQTEKVPKETVSQGQSHFLLFFKRAVCKTSLV